MPRFSLLVLLFFLLAIPSVVSQTPSPDNPLLLTGEDVRIQAFEDGYHLIIKAKPGLGSILVSEAFEPPKHDLATYTFRALEPNGINGREKRLLNGKFLKQPNTFLISSTPVDDAYFGKAFVILVPPVLEYGFQNVPGTRYGRTDLKEELAKKDAKVWFSLRAFAKPYADYSGAYQDNGFEIKSIAVDQAIPVDKGKYVKGFEALFHRLGPTYKAAELDDAVRHVQALFQDDQDVVLCIDTTQSMTKDLQAFRSDLLAPLKEEAGAKKNFRMGLVFYKDYMAVYMTEILPFQTNLAVVQKALESHDAGGGGDIPEAAVEGMYKAVTSFPWTAAHRLVVVLADAPQHDTPRGIVTEDMLRQAVQEKGVDLQLVMLPIEDY